MLKINARHVNPFVEAAMKVVTQIAGIEVRRGHLSYKERMEPSFDISIIIGMYGYLTGQIVYSMEEKLARRLVDKMLEGKSPEEREIMSLDCLGEVANMITGNAVSLLNKRANQVLNITTPVIATGADLNVHLVPDPALVLGLITPYGPIEISIAVEETEALREAAVSNYVLVGEA